MAKIDQFVDGEIGSSILTKVNEAIKTVEVSGSTISGDGTVVNPLIVDAYTQSEVDTLISNIVDITGLTYTGGNGITVSETTINLGGNVTSNVEILNNQTNGFYIGNDEGGAFSNTYIWSENNIQLGITQSGVFTYVNMSKSNISITGNVSDGFGGLKYGQDYSSNYSTRSLIDKEYVDTLITASGGTTYTSGNGITISGSVINLGGDLTADNTIETTGGEHTLTIHSVVDEQYTRFSGSNVTVSLDSGTYISYHTPYGVQIQGPSEGINIQSGQMIFSKGSTHYIIPSKDTITINSLSSNFSGLTYSSDYSSKYTTRSLTDKGYVDSAYTSGNGITVSGGVVSLGGNLTSDNTIETTGGEHTLKIHTIVDSQYTTFTGANVEVSLDDQTYRTYHTPYGLQVQAPSSVSLQIQAGQIILANTNTHYIITGRDDMTVRSLSSNFSGLTYYSDYSANYSTRSLVDKGYVDSYYTSGLTDGAPTYVEITNVLGTAASRGSGFRTVIKDTNGTGLMYFVASDGTNWYYWSGTQAV